MAARAMWKGVVRFDDVRVPVKLYAALEDRDVHFRLLHAADHAPVRQGLVNPETDAVIEHRAARRAYVTPEGDLVMLNAEELAGVEPPESREIRIVKFLPPEAIDHRWYLRPYYLGPDEGAAEAHGALASALAQSGREGLARWVMRKKAYVGALRLHAGHPMLVALRHAEEVVPLEELGTPAGPQIDKKELAMARQLIEMLAAEFDPSEYHDAYRTRLLELIERKQRGGAVRTAPAAPARATEDLAQALRASLRQERKSA